MAFSGTNGTFLALFRTCSSLVTLFPRIGLRKLTRSVIAKDSLLLGKNILLRKNVYTENTKIARLFLPVRSYCSAENEDKVRISVTFITPQGKRILVEAESENLIEFISQNYSDEFFGMGACIGSCSCGSCLIYMKPEDYERHKYSFASNESDLIDTAWNNPGPYCRLLCQLETKKLNGLELKLPDLENHAKTALKEKFLHDG